jgi:hypothetical protein
MHGDRSNTLPHTGPVREMKPTGSTGKDKPGKATPPETPDPAIEPDKADPAAPERKPVSENQRAGAAAANPLRKTADGDRSEAEKGLLDEPGRDPATSATEPEPEPDTPNGTPSSPSPKERNGEDGQHRASRRRRPANLPSPVAWTSLNLTSLLWPSVTTRKGARRASRYGLIALTIVALFTLNEVRTELFGVGFDPAENWTPLAQIGGATVAWVVVWIGYYFHSRIAALLSLVGFAGLIVFLYRADGTTSTLAIVIQAVLLYMLLHGVHGTIAYHVHGRKKRRKISRYRYKGD